MSLSRRSIAAGALASLVLAAAPWSDAHACGGGVFTPDAETEAVKTTGHRVVISISTTQTVIWDQVKFTGNPAEFAWIYPVKAGAYLEVGSDAWLETLDAGTAAKITSPELFCDEGGGGEDHMSCACGGAALAGDGVKGGAGGGFGGENPEVTVKHSGSVGPYETVTLASSTPGALSTWLTQNGYSIPATAQPILDDYVAQGFDFIAVRLQPDQGVAAMQPLRVITPGPLMSFPMRMLSVGATGNVAIELFVIAEGRLDVQNFPTATLDPKKLDWDFDSHTSNYVALRAEALAANEGRTWLTTHAKQGSLLQRDESAGFLLSDQSFADSIAGAYFAQGTLNGETTSDCSEAQINSYAESTKKVVDGPATADQLSKSELTCDTLEDLGTALVGMHPADVWVTRLEADLPVAALTEDLEIGPSTGGEVASRVQAKTSANAPCSLAALPSTGADRPGSTPRLPPKYPRGMLVMTVIAAALASALGRRATRRRPALA